MPPNRTDIDGWIEVVVREGGLFNGRQMEPRWAYRFKFVVTVEYGDVKLYPKSEKIVSA